MAHHANITITNPNQLAELQHLQNIRYLELKFNTVTISSDWVGYLSHLQNIKNIRSLCLRFDTVNISTEWSDFIPLSIKYLYIDIKNSYIGNITNLFYHRRSVCIWCSDSNNVVYNFDIDDPNNDRKLQCMVSLRGPLKYSTSFIDFLYNSKIKLDIDMQSYDILSDFEKLIPQIICFKTDFTHFIGHPRFFNLKRLILNHVNLDQLKTEIFPPQLHKLELSFDEGTNLTALGDYISNSKLIRLHLRQQVQQYISYENFLISILSSKIVTIIISTPRSVVIEDHFQFAIMERFIKTNRMKSIYIPMITTAPNLIETLPMLLSQNTSLNLVKVPYHLKKKYPLVCDELKKISDRNKHHHRCMSSLQIQCLHAIKQHKIKIPSYIRNIISTIDMFLL
jgi:hypothetical protein